MVQKTRVGVLISGRGSNLQALIDACQKDDFPAEIGLVVSNKAGAQGLDRAREAGIATACIDHTLFEERELFEEEMDRQLREAKIKFLCLAGFMRILTPYFIDRWRDKLINIHPSLLPAFKGVSTHERAIESGVRIHGCTVHFVRPEMDDGPIIGQAAVPVLPGDDADSLSRRVLEAEHRLYPTCLKLLVEGKARVTAERVRMQANVAADPDRRIFNPSV
ncbi:phosphoribosylglycinamide formyltransferase [Marinicauda pacifica]|jgi:phosphoribosylglycinamide formyltransferase-1|uniref:Phosphoribosylglycinamide formyltransferase n=1 Tax=Marinicauda pacifica TaxID=1133559 RepID=A0A4S2HE50_9PROT|nr:MULTISPECIES: phosphoribosylglycinamide formyltransferase [Marinicauda]TGY94327.1 phosphoribosylglycinamide formyltransferase [Marinicauda pacifica]GGE34906.1 phosphoribosylglycinamide formyltransferase [Marinicauda pacifica]